MVGYFVSLPATPVSDAFAWAGIVRRVWRSRILVALASLISGFGFWLIGAFLEPVYRAEAVVALVEQERSSASALMTGQLGRLASIAGIDAGSGSGRQELLAVLSSRSLYATFIEQEQLMPVLFPDRWDNKSQQWRRKGNSSGAPTLDQAIEKLRRKVFKVWMDRDTGLVKVTAEHADPAVAASLVNSLLRVGNELVREKVSGEATLSLRFLEEELARAQDVETRQLIAHLMQQQLSTRMLTSVRPDYAYKVVDPAYEPDRDRYVRPRRLLYAVLGVFLGFFLSAIWFVSRPMR